MAAAAAPKVAPARKGRTALLIGAPLATAAVIAGVMLWQSQRTPALRMRDTVVLADFRNRTGDAMFDDTLGEALGVQLRQSPFLNLLPEQQIQTTLQQMGREQSEALTPEVAREVCQRTASKAMLGGTIAMLGSSYVLTLAAQNCVDGTTLAEQQVQAASKEEVITKLGQAASTLRETLGESLASVKRYNADIEQATTRSLDALKAYTMGMAARRTAGDFDSVPFFRRAVEQDPDFALAHARLGTVLSNLGERDEAKKAASRAYELRDKVSERERLYIEARYFTTVTRDQLKAIESYRLLLATYPDDYAGHSNLGSLYRDRNMMPEAIRHLEEAVRLAPGQPIGRTNLGFAYLAEDRFPEARREFEEVLKLQESTSARNGLFTIATLTNDAALADAQVQAVKGRRDEADLTALRAQAAGYRGQMKEAERLSDELFRQVQGTTKISQAAQSLIELAITQGLAGRTDVARAQLERVQKLAAIPDNATYEVIALSAILNDPKMAAAYAERAVQAVRKSSSPEALVQNETAGKSLVALAAGRTQEAYNLAIAAGVNPGQHNAPFVAGVAALRLQKWDDAAKAFQTMIDNRKFMGMSSLVGAGYIMLGRAHAGAHRTAEAKQAYEEAFSLWKQGDADMPLLVDARNEYSALK